MRYRVAWSIGGQEGHGDWFTDRATVEAAVASMNGQYGWGTHWMEVGPP